jgi:arylsulfatase
MGSRAFYKDGWIASAFGPRVPWETGVDPSILKWSPKDDVWELYDLSKDFSQAKDVAAANPEKLKELKSGFDVSATDNKVNPVGGGLWSAVFHPEDAPSNPARTFNYTQDVVGVPEFTAPRLGSRSTLVTIDADLQADSEGVLYAIGAVSGGIALWVENGKLHYEYNLFSIERTKLETSAPLPTGKVKIEVETRKAGDARPTPLDIVVRVDGQEVITGRVPRSAALTFTANDAFDVGRDSYSPVSFAYFDRKPFAFNGKIRHLKVDYLD